MSKGGGERLTKASGRKKDIGEGERKINFDELREILKIALNELRRYKGGNILLLSPPITLLDLQIGIIKHFVVEEKMDGVVVTLSRPHSFLHRALKHEINDDERYIIYVDPLQSIAGNLIEPPTLKSKVFIVDGPFEVDRIYAAIDRALSHAANNFEGEEHFIYIDNLLGLAPYVEAKDIIKLANKIAKSYKGSFVHRVISIGMIESSGFQKIYRKIKGKMDIVITVD